MKYRNTYDRKGRDEKMNNKKNIRKWEDVERVVSMFFDSGLHTIPMFNEKGKKLLLEVKKQVYADENLSEELSLGHFQSSGIFLSMKAVEKFQEFLKFVLEVQDSLDKK